MTTSRLSSGTTASVRVVPSRSTVRVTGRPTDRLMASVTASRSVNEWPFTATITSPTFNPARCAGVDECPANELNAAISMEEFDWLPMKTRNPQASRNAITKCMNDPAEATMIRL
jgi:hypothetical protein